MAQPRGRRCFEKHCNKYPSFGVEGTKTAIFCSKHAVDGMVDVKSKRCSQEGCRTYPAYGWRGSTRAEYCARHADKGMINVKSKMCWHENCCTQASHGWAGSSSKAEFCARHADPGMTNVVRKRCSYEGCSTHPSHGLKDTRKPVFCSKHASEDMVDVVSRRCSHEGCLKSPSFGFPGTMKAKFCATHADHAMVDVKRRRCNRDGCSTNPSFGWEGFKKAEYCAKHAQQGMVNVRKNRSGHTPERPREMAGRRSNGWQVGESDGAGNLGRGRRDGVSPRQAESARGCYDAGMESLIHCGKSLIRSEIRPDISLTRPASQSDDLLICSDSRSLRVPGGDGGSQNDGHTFAFTRPCPPFSPAEIALSHTSSGNDRQGVVIPLLHGDGAHGTVTCEQRVSMFRLQRLGSTTVT